MAEELTASVELVNQKFKFTGTAMFNDPVSIDYVTPMGDGEGYTSLELFLLSFASCSASSILFLLRKSKKNISGLKVNAKGIRRETHPTSFEKINLEYVVNSPDVTNADIEKVLKLSEETYCPVWAMIKNNVVVNTVFQIIN
ncbi:MAG: OsmC family protein [Ignavibacteriaceae bacterium]|nr:OsmC family protein [Ignavibacteriaceae bacterium]